MEYNHSMTTWIYFKNLGHAKGSVLKRAFPKQIRFWKINITRSLSSTSSSAHVDAFIIYQIGISSERKIRCVAMNILLLYIISLNFPLFMVEVICLYHAYRFFIFYDIPTYPSNILTPQYNWPFLKFIIYNFLMGVFPMDLICMNIRISCWKVELLAFFKSFNAWKEEKIDYCKGLIS